MRPHDQWTEEAVAERLKNLFADEAPASPLIAAAAVLATFEPDRLRPFGQTPENLDTAREDLLAHAEPAQTPDGRPCWVLTRDARREVLRQLLDARHIEAALAVNPDRELDLVQHTLEALLRNPSQLPPLKDLQHVRAYQVVADWLAGLVPGLLDPEALRNLADRATQLAPFHELVGEYFAGRTRELALLGDYVDILAPSGPLEALTRAVRSVLSIVEEPPLFVFGPGGIGKSTLIAKFILDHVDNPGVPQFPYAYLDLDRPGVVAEEPITLLIEALRQLALQYPESRPRLTALQREWADKIAVAATPLRMPPSPEPLRPPKQRLKPPARETREEAVAETRVRRFEPIWSRLRLGERDYYIETFAHAIRALQPGAQPMLLVLDTFEEVQLRSAAHVSDVFAFLEQLQRQIPFLRTVLCGRIPPSGHQTRELELISFDMEGATAYLTARVRIDREMAETVARQVTGSPLTLKLAADLLRKEQSIPGGLKDLGAVLGDLRKGSIEAQLYTRVLNHIEDPEVRKLAHPGLLLRRITADIIEKVLAVPCGLSVPDRNAADRLFQKLRSEVVLVGERSPDVLVHRSELRAVMLGPLRDSEPDRVAEIHQAAVRYYEAVATDPEMRAEEIYHRLSMAFDRPSLERRWMEGMDRFLAHAIAELPPQAQGFLAARQNLTLDPAMWAQVDVEDWERYAIRELREYLRVGRLDDALALLAQRKDLLSVDLRLLHVETLVRTGNLDGARKLALETIALVPPDSVAARTLHEQLRTANVVAGAADSLAGTALAKPVTMAGPHEDAPSHLHVRTLAEALWDAFSHVDRLLELLRRFGLTDVADGLPLSSALPAGREAASLALLIAARATSANQLASLVLAARRSRPDNVRLWSVADTLGLLPRGSSDVSAIRRSILRGQRPGDVRAALTRLEAQTCLVSAAVNQTSISFSSGFLVGPDLVLTSIPVLVKPEQTGSHLSLDDAVGERLSVTFDRWVTDTEVTMSGVQVPLATRWLAAYSAQSRSNGTGLSYVLLRLAEPIGNMPGADRGRRGWMELQSKMLVSSGAAVATLRFDSRQALFFSLSATGMRDRDDEGGRLRYEIDGEPLGLGSPVFDDHLRVVALDLGRADSGWLAGLTHRQLREGVPADLIVRDLDLHGILLSPPDRRVATSVSMSNNLRQTVSLVTPEATETYMPDTKWSPPTRLPLPLILIQGFGGLGIEDEKRVAYQGFNDGTVYPEKGGDNYRYEGMILKFMNSTWQYQDATNVVRYFSTPFSDRFALPSELGDIPEDFFFVPAGADESLPPLYKVVIDPGMALTIRDKARTRDPYRTLWVFRYYDLDARSFQLLGDTLVRLISFIRELAAEGAASDRTMPKVNIIAHSMGGLIVREAIQRSYPNLGQLAGDHINKVVTLGTPHQGISYQVLSHWIGIDAKEELDHFSPYAQADPRGNPAAFGRLREHFDLQRFLTVVGTNHRSYEVKAASSANRLFSGVDEYRPNYNRSDGLVKQRVAQIPGAPRTFVHKCHGGVDSLVTSREAFEIATRFFFGTLRARLRMLDGVVTRGKDFFGKSEFFLGVSIKARRIDFDLFAQSVEAENCYGPFSATNEHGDVDFSEPLEKLAVGWADDRRLIWEGYFDTGQMFVDPSTGRTDMVFRLDFYVGERDLFGIGFSDNVVFRKQYYLRAFIDMMPPEIYLLTNEGFMTDVRPGQPAMATEEGWTLKIGGESFIGTFQLELDGVPEEGFPVPIRPDVKKPAQR